ncbi:MAG: hypothetical protein ACRC2S_22355 [Waterburya sp.]
MWTDSFLEQIFPIEDETGKVKTLAIWLNGENAERLDALSSRELENTVKDKLQQNLVELRIGVSLTRSWLRYY